MKTNSYLFTGVVLSILIPLGTSVSYAMPDGKTLPGTTCQPRNGSQPFVNTVGGAVFNQSAAPQTFVCPIVRDRMSADNDGIDDFRMKVYDRHPNQNVSCTLRSMRDNGSIRASSTRTTSNFAAGVKTLNFPALARSANGYYNVYCSLPRTHSNGSSGILMYKVDEEI